MPTRRSLIQKIELFSNTSTVVFSNIPQNYTDLLLLVSARNSGTTVADTQLRFNGATTDANLAAAVHRADGTSAGSTLRQAQSYGQIGFHPPSNSTANTYSHIRVEIPQYTSSTNKLFRSTSCQENMATTAYIHSISAMWTTTSPITSIQIVPGISTYTAGSTFYLYGITHVPIINGGKVSIRGGFKYHTFRSTGTLQVVEPGDVEYLVVAGGGGGAATGGGGGAGGLLTGKSRLSNGLKTVTIGSGGTAGIQATGLRNGTSGTSSSIDSISATGGGYGSRGAPVGNGGSGGGTGSVTANATLAGGTGISGQGFSGGSSTANSGGDAAGSGGGGASAAGQSVSGLTNGGNGGAGAEWPISSGTYYAGGGGGGPFTSSTPGSGGIGGGGRAGSFDGSGNVVVAVQNGQVNTGGGGGGTSAGWNSTNAPAGNGGSGIVVIRYPYDGN